MNFDDINPAYKRLKQGDWDEISGAAYGFYVEVGTNYGASACAAATKADRVVTIDIFDWQPKVFEGNDKVAFFKGTSVDYAAELRKTGELIDVLFIDGAHEYEYVMKDCESLAPLVKPGGIIMFHDHNPNNPITRVYEAVNFFLSTFPHEAFPKNPEASNLLKIRKL